MKKMSSLGALLSTLVLLCLTSCGGGGSTVSSGSPDTSFVANGMLKARFTDKVYFNKMIVQGDGKYLALGAPTDTATTGYFLVRFNPDGSLDKLFGTNGMVSITPGPTMKGIAVQSDGKILVAGYSKHGASTDSDMDIHRFDSQGKPDTSWGSSGNGQIIISLPGTDEYALGVAVQSDGYILVTGTASDDAKYNNNFLVLRLAAQDGAIDTTFGSGGMSRTPIPTGSVQKVSAEANRIVFQSDGKAVVAGTVFRNISSNLPALVRYRSDGVVDTTFGAGGIVTDTAGTTTALVIQKDGMICQGTDYKILRYTAAGAPDQSFGTKGAFALSSAYLLSGLSLDSQGRLLAVANSSGTDYRNKLIFRLLQTGVTDTTFGSNGVIVANINNYGYKSGVGSGAVDWMAVDITVQSDGKFVVAGYTREPGATTSAPTYYDLVLLRFNP